VITAVCALEAWPITRLFWTSNGSLPLLPWERPLLVTAFAATFVALAITFEGSRRSAQRALARL